MTIDQALRIQNEDWMFGPQTRDPRVSVLFVPATDGRPDQWFLLTPDGREVQVTAAEAAAARKNG